MTFSDIVDLVVAKVGKTDDYARARCLEFVQRRHKYIWDSYDWTAAKTIVSTPVTETTFDVANAEKVISARFNGEFIDPVSPSYIFESRPELIDVFGKPLFYWSHYNTTTSSMAVTLYPGIDAAGPYYQKTLDLLVKKPYDTNATTTFLSNIDNALIAFALADMWEMLRQLTKYQAKLSEAEKILTDEQQADSPSVPRPRSTKALTVNGSTLIEMTDSVCDIIGRWEPDIRESVKERLRRNNDVLWNMQLWPESLIVGNVDISAGQSQIVLPHYFDRVIDVRTNEGGPITGAFPLMNTESPWYFDVDYTIFEASGQPRYYNFLSPIATSSALQFSESIMAASSAGTNGGQPMPHPHGESDQGVEIFVKGEVAGAEKREILILPLGGFVPGPLYFGDPTVFVTSVNNYDTIQTIAKPVTSGTIDIYGATSMDLLQQLLPEETERRHIRIEIRPNFSSEGLSDDPGSVLVCGKRKLALMLDDLDSPQLRNAHNVLIAGAAADMFDRLGNGDMAAKYQQKAAALTQVLIDAELKQNTVQQRIVPYVESSCDSIYGGW